MEHRRFQPDYFRGPKFYLPSSAILGVRVEGEDEMSVVKSREFRLFAPSASIEDMNDRLEILLETLNSAIQDIAVLKDILREKGIWDPELYKRLRIERMINDHATPGPPPWKWHSLFPYMLKETDFLRDQFQASEPEIKEFKARVDSVETVT